METCPLRTIEHISATKKLADIIFNMTDPSQYQYPSPLEGYEHLPPLPEYVTGENETEKDQEC